MNADGQPSGRILLRLPRGLHARLIDEAHREGVSLNQFAVAALAGAVGWRLQDGDTSRLAVELADGTTIATESISIEHPSGVLTIPDHEPFRPGEWVKIHDRRD
ncbi:toxin-antitoxin system HicB family antitoxin [Miltoncostaea marina]|uniref:toxin-antitoxin system HicB family antitoxin n=1 Tax=Miltoncostaea marina TaxID=2843215 RepID=UPI001C3CD3A7|nr:toxin-antitoxin system HicB family antitoxin [Miltoncostaea marina]